MSDTAATLSGECFPWPTKDALVDCLAAAGLNVHIGPYSVRVAELGHFVFRHLGGDISTPTIDADAEDVETLTRDAQKVSSALATAGVRHRLAVYDADENLSFYVHYEWPAEVQP